MNYQELKTLKAQVEFILHEYPITRDCDEELAKLVASRFNRSALSIMDNVKRYRRHYAKKYPPTKKEVAERRRVNMDEWRVSLGYPTTNGSYVPPSEKRSEEHREMVSLFS